MAQLTERVGPCKARDTDNPAADREFVIAAVRTARTRAELIVREFDEIGIALKYDMLPLERAMEWLHDIDALHIVNPDVWCERGPELAPASKAVSA